MSKPPWSGLSKPREHKFGRALHALLGLTLAFIAVTTPSTSTVAGGQIWEWIGLVSAVAWFTYAARPTMKVLSVAIGTFLVQAVPRSLVWAYESRWAPAAIWGGWVITMVLVWMYRPRQREN